MGSIPYRGRWDRKGRCPPPETDYPRTPVSVSPSPGPDESAPSRAQSKGNRTGYMGSGPNSDLSVHILKGPRCLRIKKRTEKGVRLPHRRIELANIRRNSRINRRLRPFFVCSRQCLAKNRTEAESKCPLTRESGHFRQHTPEMGKSSSWRSARTITGCCSRNTRRSARRPFPSGAGDSRS